MSASNTGFVDTELSKKTPIFGLHLWVVIGIVLGAAIVLIFFVLTLCVTALRRRSCGKDKTHHNASEITRAPSKGNQEIIRSSAAADERPIVPTVYSQDLHHFTDV